MNKSKNINIGRTTDSIEILEQLCHTEAQKLKQSSEIIDGDINSVTFWTKDFPELIGIANFSKDADGKIVFDLDFDESTL